MEALEAVAASRRHWGADGQPDQRHTGLERDEQPRNPPPLSGGGPLGAQRGGDGERVQTQRQDERDDRQQPKIVSRCAGTSATVTSTDPTTRARIAAAWLRVGVHHDDEAQAIIHRLLDAVPPGSYLVIAHASNEVNPPEAEAARRFWNEHAKPPDTFRTGQQITRFFDRVELLDPGRGRVQLGPDQ